MPETKILAPFTAVRIAWAIAGKFASEPEGRISAQNGEEVLKKMSAQAAGDPRETSYITQSEAAVQASVRNLEVVYKARKLNFDENEKLRQAYMDNVKDGIQFGSKAMDYLKALPAMAIAGPGVAGTLGPAVARYFGIGTPNQSLFLWGFGAAMAGLGYLIHMSCVRLARKRTQMLYVAQDFDRNRYYGHYIARVEAVLIGLYHDIDRIHEHAFDAPYPMHDGNAASAVDELLRGVRPTMCRYVQKHMSQGLITPADWTLCEVGEPDSRQCVHWR